MEAITAADWVKINNVTLKINQTKNNNSMRLCFLQELKYLIDYDFGIFDLCKEEDGKFSKLFDPVIVSDFDEEFEKKFISLYDKKYYKISYNRWIHYEKSSFVYRETDCISQSLREKSQYYKEYLEPTGLTFSCGCNIVSENSNLGVVTLYRTENNGDFTDYETKILEMILPHLISNLALRYEMITEKGIKKLLIFDYELTKRELEIIEKVFLGFGNKKIADNLFISENTVKKHLNNVYKKIDVKSRSQLINFLNEKEFKI